MSNSKLSAENEARLRAAIAHAGLGAAEKLIARHARECVSLTTPAGVDENAPLGASRLGGLPDLPPGDEWQRAPSGRYFLPFAWQIHLADVPPFAGRLLPDRGMLYLWSNGEEAIVQYRPDADPATLTRTAPPPDGDSDLAAARPCPLTLTAALDLPEWTTDAETEIVDALEGTGDADAGDRYRDLARRMMGRGGNDYDGEWAGKLQGRPCWIGYVPDWAEADGDESRFLLLLSNSNRSADILWGDAGYLLVYADPEETRAGRIEATALEAESS